MANAAKSDFEIAVINRVKEIRMKRKLSQYDLASILGTSSSFIGQVEVPTHPSKYNLDHLNKIAFELGCSPQDFIPAKPITEKDWEK